MTSCELSSRLFSTPDCFREFSVSLDGPTDVGPARCAIKDAVLRLRQNGNHSKDPITFDGHQRLLERRKPSARLRGNGHWSNQMRGSSAAQ